MKEKENPTKGLKFYSPRAIGIATIIGGPLAAGYLIRENYLALNDPENGKKSLIIGIISTILIFGGIFLLPESTIDKIPRQLIPFVYTGIIYLIVEKIHGTTLKAHKENKNEFLSGWKAAGIGFISLLIIGIGILGYIFLSTNDEIYDTELAKFQKNENETLIFYDHLNTENRMDLLQELDSNVIPKWKENIQILKQTDLLESLPFELVEQNKILLKYSELRVKAFELFRKAIDEDTDKYFDELNQIDLEIDKQLQKLN